MSAPPESLGHRPDVSHAPRSQASLELSGAVLLQQQSRSGLDR